MGNCAVRMGTEEKTCASCICYQADPRPCPQTGRCPEGQTGTSVLALKGNGPSFLQLCPCPSVWPWTNTDFSEVGPGGRIAFGKIQVQNNQMRSFIKYFTCVSIQGTFFTPFCLLENGQVVIMHLIAVSLPPITKEESA